MPFTKDKEKEYMEKFKKAKHVVTHCHIFHADESAAVAYLQELREFLKLPPLHVHRAYDGQLKPYMTLDNGYIVLDTGFGEFDHHFSEKSKERRDNGIEYAAFGLIVRAFHYHYLNETEYKMFDERFVIPIDYHDNHGKLDATNSISQAISAMNFGWDDPNRFDSKLGDERFMKAVDILRVFIKSTIESIRSTERAKTYAAQQFLVYNTVFMDKKAPTPQFYANNPDIKFVGYPASRTEREYRVVSVKDPTGVYKQLFPKSIRGNNKDAKFMYENKILDSNTSGTFAEFESKEAAKEFMLKYT